MAIRNRGNHFQVDVAVKGQRVRATAETRREAEIVEAQLKADLLAGKPVTVAKRGSVPATLGQLQQRVYERVWRGTKNERGARMNSQAAVDFFGSHRSIGAIDTHAVDEWVEELENKGNSDATINNKLAALSKMLRFAHKRGWIDKMPHLERKRTSNGRLFFLSKDQERSLIETSRQWGYDDHADLWLFLIDTGLRVGEALRLTWDDVTLVDKPCVTVWESKNGESRTVPLTLGATEILRSRKQDDYNCPFGLTYRAVYHAWKRVAGALGQVGNKHWVPHILRHTCASRLVQAGVPILTVKEWLGHKSIQVTMRYAHLAPKNLFDAAKQLEDAT